MFDFNVLQREKSGPTFLPFLSLKQLTHIVWTTIGLLTHMHFTVCPSEIGRLVGMSLSCFGVMWPIMPVFASDKFWNKDVYYVKKTQKN